MHISLVHVTVKPDRIDAFIAETRVNYEASIREPGNQRFDVLQDDNDPGHFLFYEVYTSEADFTAHKQTAHYFVWRDAVADMMAAPRKGEPWRSLFLKI